MSETEDEVQGLWVAVVVREGREWLLRAGVESEPLQHFCSGRR